MVNSIITKTIDYLAVPAVVGYENIFMEYLAKDFQDLGLNVIKADRYVSITGNSPNSAIICAHLDRHGLISLGQSEYVYAAQYIKEIKYGENNRLATEQIQSIADRFEGEMTYAYDPNTGNKLGEGRIESCNPCMAAGDALFYVQNMTGIEHGIPLAYARTARFENGQLKGQIDNAISLGIVYELFAQGFQGTALLTTEEEIGKSWIHIKEYLETNYIETKNLLVLDTSPYSNNPEAVENGHVIFRNRDMSEEFNPELVSALKKRAEDLGFIYQVKDEAMINAGRTQRQLGSTELGRLVQGTLGRWNGATIQIPTFMYHTSNETTTEVAIENYFAFLRNILIDDKLSILESKRGDA